MVPKVLIKQLFYESSSLVCNYRYVFQGAVFIFSNTELIYFDSKGKNSHWPKVKIS